MSASDIAVWVAVILAFMSAWVGWLQLRGQLRDIARQTASLERDQASSIDLAFDPAFDEVLPPKDIPWYTKERPWFAVVTNNSKRPITDVICGIPSGPHSGKSPVTAIHWVELDEWPIKVSQMHVFPRLSGGDLGEHSELHMLRGGKMAGFTFKHEDWRPGVVIQFTDDAGLRWQIDDDLHLAKVLYCRDWWILAPPDHPQRGRRRR
jgi:hypothetical protein